MSVLAVSKISLQYLVLFVLMYAPNFKLTGDSASLAILAISMALCINQWPRLMHYVNWNQLRFAFMLFFAYLSVQLIALFGRGDLTAFSTVKAYIFFFVPCSMFLLGSICADHKEPFSRICLMLTRMGTFQAVCIILDFFFPLMRSLFSMIVVQHPALEYSLVRAGGLSSSTGDTLSFIQAFLGIIAINLYLENRIGGRFFSIAYFLNVISMLFVGRTGLMLLFIGSLILPLLKLGLLRSIRFWSAGLMLSALLFVGIFLMLPGELRSFMQEKLLPYALEIFYSAFNEGSLESGSTNDMLENMIVFPVEQWAWLFGYGIFLDPVIDAYNYMGTDIGYLRIIFYCGLVGSIVLYGGFLSSFLRAYFQNRHSSGPLLLVLGLMFFVANIKVAVFFFGPFVSLFFLMLSSSKMEQGVLQKSTISAQQWRRLLSSKKIG
ncbi:hypothetical protein N8I74_14295 [Chitiniphilus purpureus]|uniref:O-antigen ligase family protein n=1 Tax=Chitiniphilus purpureus TaxID=2981137 RepID=A0ABY6DJR7_9NEIS|nr:hypothetical protein [Chitiniphilus sp. CD1]UXY14478.1 hypothetical protein N8I74_14295 [Chitiniphilus sp. CD1]